MRRSICLVLMLSMGTFAFGQSNLQDLNKKLKERCYIAIDAGSLGQALEQIHVQTGIKIHYPDELVAGKTASRGTYRSSLENVLHRLLDQFDLVFEATAEGAIRILQALEMSTIRGTIRDAQSNEPLPNVNIFIENTTIGSATDQHGSYEIKEIPRGIHRISVRTIGYKRQSFDIDLTKGRFIEKNIFMEPDIIQFEAVSVVAERDRFAHEQEISSFSMKPRQVSMMGSYGQMDVMRAVQLLPGVLATNEYKSQLHIRGGNADQNLVLMDGGIIYNPFHFSGILSAFDVDALEKVDVFTGGFGAEYGGRLSSVLDIRTRRGSESFSNKVDLSPLSAKILTEGPIWKFGNYLLSFRQSYASKAAKTMGDRIEPEFYDGIGRLDLQPTLKDHIWVSGFMGKDVVRLQKDQEEKPITSENRSFAFSHSRVFFKKIQSLLNVTYGRFMTEMPTPIKTEESQTNTLRDVAGNYTMSVFVRDNLHFKLGVSYHNIFVHYQSLDPIVTKLTIDKTFSESAFFVHGNYEHNDRWYLDSGIRLSGYQVNKSLVIEPRLNLQYSIFNFLKLRCGLGRFSQNMVTIYNENDTYSPVDIWLPPESSLKSAVADHVILGLCYETPWLNASVETYYKRFNNLTHYNRERLHPDDPFFIQGRGQSMGVDVSVQWMRNKWQLWTSYSLGKATKELPFQYPTPGMVKFAPRYDRRHNLSLSFEYIPVRKLSLSCRFTFGSGMPFSFMIGAYERWSSWYINQPSDYPSHSDDEISSYLTAVKSDLDAFRFPVYHRLDISARYAFALWRLDIAVYAQILNLYDHSNVLYYDVYGEPYFSLPFLPMAGLEISL